MQKDLYTLEKEKIEKLNITNFEKIFLSTPQKEITFTIPVEMDSGEKRIFKGYRIQHNNALGPYKGGLRFVKNLDINTLRALSIWMSWKCAIANLPLGGAKGGVDCDINILSSYEQQQICRGYVREIFKNIGPNTDIPGPDVNTNSQHMLYMMDEYEKITGQKNPGVTTGKPVGLGGSVGRDRATGYGLVYVLHSYLSAIKMDIKKTSAAIQGFGEVGENAGELFSHLGGVVKAVSFYHNDDKKTYTVYKEDGINIDKLSNVFTGFDVDINDIEKLGYEILDGDSWYKTDVDVLIPAATENQIDEKVVKAVSRQVKIICEGANGPTTKDGDNLAKERGIFILPDVLCNSGGVTCSYFEQIQNSQNYYWEEKLVFSRLEKSMVDAFNKVYSFSIKKNVSMRDACFLMATDKILVASKKRGEI